MSSTVYLEASSREDAEKLAGERLKKHRKARQLELRELTAEERRAYFPKTYLLVVDTTARKAPKPKRRFRRR